MVKSMVNSWPEAEVFQRFEAQLLNFVPALRDEAQPRSWYWHVVQMLPGHILINFDVFNPPSAKGHYALAWPRGGDLFQVDSLEKVVHLVTIERLTIVDDLADILRLFCFFQAGESSRAKWVLQDIAEVEMRLRRDGKKHLISKYAAVIGPPACVLSEDEPQARLWAIDRDSGDLEEWLFSQKAGQFRTEFWVMEKDLIKNY
jgi:hypothetical protein